ncbi:MAG: hypothetical protein L3J35_10090 [Bacteroidales bacterium]|nr:hypothetical protein [Bacteroidales bacterium]
MSLKRIIILSYFLFFTTVNYAQFFQEEICGHIGKTFSKNLSFRNYEKIKLHLDYCNYNPYIENIKYRIPVKFWIYRKSDGTGGLSEIQIKEHLRNLNHYHSTNNTGIRFYLRPDIEYIDKDRLFKLKYLNQAPFQTLKRKSKSCINIYVAEKLKMNRVFNIPKNFSGTYNSFSKGIIIAKGVSSSTLTHEIGHYLGLKHPHKHWKSKIKSEPVSRTRLIPGTNTLMCEKKGDGLCDTPAEPNLSNYTDDNCKYTGRNVKDKYGEEYKPATDNIMSYTKNRECRNNFTQEQIALMLYTASKNKYSKYWSDENKNFENYNFDYFEPDNTKNTASEIFLRTIQTHTFHEILTKSKKKQFYDRFDWLYFDLNTSKPQTYKITVSKSEYEFPKIKITVFFNEKIIQEKIIENIENEENILLYDISKGRYFINIQKISNYNKIKSYKIKVEKSK